MMFVGRMASCIRKIAEFILDLQRSVSLVKHRQGLRFPNIVASVSTLALLVRKHFQPENHQDLEL